MRRAPTRRKRRGERRNLFTATGATARGQRASTRAECRLSLNVVSVSHWIPPSREIRNSAWPWGEGQDHCGVFQGILE